MARTKPHSASALDDGVDAQSVFVRQVAIMVRQARRGAMIVLTGVVLISALALPAVGWPRVLIWASAVVFAVTCRSTALLYLQKGGDDPTRWARSELVLTICAAFLGLCVASAGLLFFPNADFRLRAMLTVIFTCWPAAAAAILGGHTKSYNLYLACYFPTLALAWLIYEPDYPIVLAMFAVFALALFTLGREIGRLVTLTAALEGQKDELIAEKDLLIGEKDCLIEELDDARMNAEAANLTKSRFLAAASHDLRQPVMALSLLAGALASASLDARGQTISRQITRALDSLGRLFNAILDLSKLEAGTVAPAPSNFGLATLAQELATEYRPRCNAKGLTMTLTTAPIYVRTDRILLERILRNLLDNAIKYTDRGCVALAIAAKDGVAEVRIEDTGLGIDVQQLPKIFDDFYQVDAAGSGRDKGLGLGLAIVRRLSDVLNIRVNAESRKGVGSVFRVVLPAALIVPMVQARDAGSSKIDLDLDGKVIVVIDDDVFVRDALELALEGWRAIPVIGHSCDAALDALAAHCFPPDLLIVDYNLDQGATGIDAIAAFRERFPSLPALLMSGDDLPATVTNFVATLRKPVANAALAKSIAQLVLSKRTLR